VTIAQAGDNLWTWAGITGTVNQIVLDPSAPNVVYVVAGANYQAARHIWKSVDAGVSWVDVAPSNWSHVARLAIAATNSSVLYAATPSGLYRSEDGGSHWTGLLPDPLDSIAVSPLDWREAFITANTAISRTVDGGLTWDARNAGLPTYPPIDQVVIAPSAPHILIAKPFNMTTGVMYKSTDSGATWSPIGLEGFVAHNTVAFDPWNSGIIYLGTFSPGGWKSTDGGATWTPMANGLANNGFAFVIDPENTQRVYAANLSNGVVASEDGGASWAPLNAGIQGLEVRALAVSHGHPSVLYAGLSTGGLWVMRRLDVPEAGVSINAGALYTNNLDVTLTLTAPPGTTQIQVSNDGGFFGAAWETYVATKPWTLTSIANTILPRTVYVRYRTDGVASGVYPDDIVVDLIAPTGSVVLADALLTASDGGGMLTAAVLEHVVLLPTVARNYLPGSRAVALRLSAADDLSGVDRMLLSGNDTLTGATPVPFAEHAEFQVPDTGAQTIFVRFLDRAGNLSSVYAVAAPAP